MNKLPLRVLIANDLPGDALLVTLHLQKNYTLIPLRVDNADNLRKALQGGEWDVVLADHTLLHLDVFAILKIVQQDGRNLPFIIVSGSPNEDLAAAAIKAGAHDYFLKDNLTRLIPAIERERQAAQARRTQLQSEQNFRATFNQAKVGIAHIAVDGHFLRVNHKLCLITGYSEAELLTRNCQSITYFEDVSDHLGSMLQLLAGEIPTFTADVRYVRKNGSLVWVNITQSVARSMAGEADYLIMVVEDITSRKESEARHRLNSRILDSINEGIMVMGATKLIVSVNPAFSTITGYGKKEVIGRNPRLLHSDLVDESFYQAMWRSIHETGQWQGEMLDRRKDGASYIKWLSINTLKYENGEVSHYIAVFSDISERKTAEERLTYMAQHDVLTGLPNRMLLQDRLTQAVAHAEREQRKVAVMFLDLDLFKDINDTLGHAIGDKLLQEIADRIRSTARASDTVSRQGGDEFVIMLPDMETTDAVAAIAVKLLETIAAPLWIDGNEIAVTTSIGISVFPEDGRDGNSLIKQADAAMYQAKKIGRNAYEFFTPEMNQRALERMAVEKKLRHALERHEFYLHYQPQVDLRSGRIIGAEALLRWNNPEAGIILPGQFISLAEENGMIIPIGEWVLREACRQNRAWRDQGLPEIIMTVNLSAVQFRQKNLGDMVMSIVRDSDLTRSGLELEITESTVMHDADAVILLLGKLKDLGVRLAVDDFGTGYSSLSHLKRFPIDKLKIDQSFVRDVMVDPDNAAITSTIISMARSLKLKVIAEGVETADQLAFLKKRECDEMQGYYFSKPMPADQITHMMASGHVVTGSGQRWGDAGGMHDQWSYMPPDASLH